MWAGPEEGELQQQEATPPVSGGGRGLFLVLLEYRTMWTRPALFNTSSGMMLMSHSSDLLLWLHESCSAAAVHVMASTQQPHSPGMMLLLWSATVTSWSFSFGPVSTERLPRGPGGLVQDVSDRTLASAEAKRPQSSGCGSRVFSDLWNSSGDVQPTS